MAAYRVFTVSSGRVEEGAEVSTLHLKGAGIDIPAILIGEEGRGRERGVLPVDNPPKVPCPERGKSVWSSADRCAKCGVPMGPLAAGGSTRQHPDDGLVTGRLRVAEVGSTKAGKPKLVSRPATSVDDKLIVVFRTMIGFRGGNGHTGDRSSWKCGKYGCDATGPASPLPEACPKCNATGSYDGPRLQFASFPGEVLVRGRIAQGDAGRAGGGEQLVALVPKGIVFRTEYSGRLYGGPGSHYYRWDGENILAATWDERAAADLF